MAVGVGRVSNLRASTGGEPGLDAPPSRSGSCSGVGEARRLRQVKVVRRIGDDIFGGILVLGLLRCASGGCGACEQNMRASTSRRLMRYRPRPMVIEVATDEVTAQPIVSFLQAYVTKYRFSS